MFVDKEVQIGTLFPSSLKVHPASTLIKIPPSKPTEVNAFSIEGMRSAGLSTLKAFSHCKNNHQHYILYDQGRLCLNSKAQGDVMNPYSRVMLQSISVALCSVNYLWALAVTLFTDLKVKAERGDFFFFYETQQKPCAVSPRCLVSSAFLLSAQPASSWPPVGPPGVLF